MTKSELVKTVAYCGLVCGVCKNACQPDCRGGGGSEDCYQRKCCIEKKLDGCWQCGDFPCNKGFFADNDDSAWRRLCTGCVQFIEEYGIESYIDFLLSGLGSVVEYGDYRYKTPQEIKTILCGDLKSEIPATMESEREKKEI